MPRNIEIKARVPDPSALRARAIALATGGPEIIEQTDTFFTVQRGRLKVRAFADGTGELIAYERADDEGPKTSSYVRAVSPDSSACVSALRAVLPVRGEVVKRRELIMIGRTRVHLDQVEGLGAFVELEVVLRNDESEEAGEREARELMSALGIDAGALVSGAYIDLLEKPRS
jgi:predicted adenylyl cyclase CyaB